MWENTPNCFNQRTHAVKGLRQLDVLGLCTQSPAKGQGSGASRWPEGVKVDLPADTSVGGPKPLCSKDPSITVTYLPCVDHCWPQGCSLLFLCSLFTPQPEADKGLFT